MEDYPRNLAEFEARFSTEAACREYLVRLRWPDGFRCLRCGGRKTWPLCGVLLQCAGCSYQSSVTAGTIFQDTRKPLSLWFRAMWSVTSQKNGASAIGLQRELGLGSYKTAWTWLHKLRRAMVRPGRDRLSGIVEVDETCWGSEEEGVRGRQTDSKALIVKRWLLGTHQGAVSREHLDYYLDEFTFRFNRRNSRSRGKLFLRLAQQAVAVGPAPYKSIVKCFGAAEAADHNI
ncbi:MAG: IS1595 family transposase [Acidobacteria bacterium]|nr:IS1595 family transposase [Acidobacteriota bacterium]